MKLKYFLRGLGTGVILSVLILCISYRTSGSGGNIVDQAKELGMVFPEGTQPPDSVETETPQPSPLASPEVQENSVSSGAGVTGTETAKPKKTKKPAAKPTKTPVPDEDTDKSVKLTISADALSGTVARKLEEMGLIEDARDFDEYMSENGYSTKIREGVFEIPVGASYSVIARIITKQY